MGLFSKGKDESGQGNSVTCASVLDISKAADLQKELLEVLGRGSAIRLNGAEVEKIDAAALQVFASFFLTAEAQKVQVQWLHPSETLCRSARLLGMTNVLGLPLDSQV